MTDHALPSTDEFARWVKDALNRLYDAPHLKSHPLVDLLITDNSNTIQRSQQMREVLLAAIYAMRPKPGVPARSSHWRAYRILELRYIEGLSPAEIMDELAISRSHYFKEQARVLEGVTNVLWDRLQTQSSQAKQAENGVTRREMAQTETERLQAQAKPEILQPAQLIAEMQPILDSLAQTKGVRLKVTSLQQLKAVKADRVMLRQAILNTITHALDSASGGEVAVSGFGNKTETGLAVKAAEQTASQSAGQADQRQGIGLNICHELMAAMGGAFRAEYHANNLWQAYLTWPVSAPPTLLVVDDNQGFVELVQRYLAGYPWQVAGAANSSEARQIIAEAQPVVIISDVMMPGEDGWEFLASLKQNEATQDIPIIVCSVLNEPQLAMMMGAAAYLPKPVTQPALLTTLAAWLQDDPTPGLAS